MSAPEPVSLVRWSASFGTRFIVFVDVEEEFDWRAPLDAASRSTCAMAAFPDAHARFADRGVALTCMVDHPIATDSRSVDILARALEDGRSAVGTQLHPWVNPPYVTTPTPGDSYAGNLPPELEAAKLTALTQAIAASFGRRPLAYRAGRYGIGARTPALLAELGYSIDSSVRARYDYSGDGGPDFSSVASHAFHLGSVVELPLTTVFTGAARRLGQPLYRALGQIPRAHGIAARTDMLSRVALTPEDMPIAAALAAVDAAVEEGVRVLVFSFHSPSLTPGHTPYVRDVNDLARFHEWWTVMLDRLEALGIRNASLDELLCDVTPSALAVDA